MSAPQHVAVFSSAGTSHTVKDMDEFSNLAVPVTLMPIGASYQVWPDPSPASMPANLGLSPASDAAARRGDGPIGRRRAAIDRP